MNTYQIMIDLQKIPNDVARIDIEKTGASTIFVRVWKKGFNPDDAGSPAFEDMLDGGSSSMSQICGMVEAQGFSMTMTGSSKARALRGPATRIDFVKQDDGWHIKKFPHGWRASTRPMSDQVKSYEDVMSAVEWCKSHGWSIYDFKGEVIRAWKGKPMPVHTAETIRILRTKHKHDHYDFAYYG